MYQCGLANIYIYIYRISWNIYTEVDVEIIKQCETVKDRKSTSHHILTISKWADGKMIDCPKSPHILISDSF